MSRPRVVLLHAFPLDCRMWAETKRALESEGWSVYAPDLPGPVADPNLGAWADRLLEAIDGPFVPVGASMGGYLAFELWRRSPGRVAGLVLVGSRASADSPDGRRGRDETVTTLRDLGVAAVWAALEGKLFSPAASPDVVARARERALEQGAERLEAAVRAMRDRPDSTSLLAEIDVPALVVVGEDDAVIPPAEAEAMAERLPDARVVRIPGAGHLAPLERPAEVNAALLDFLRELAA